MARQRLGESGGPPGIHQRDERRAGRHHGDLAAVRRLNLGDHLAAAKRSSGVGDDLCSGCFERLVAEARGEAGAALDEDLDLELFGESANALGRKRDSLLVWSGFGWDADFHEVAVVGVAAVEALRTPSGIC
jgi:hypothetical protein